ncbi:hypothetical protein ACS0TY_013614 [Phlomoides rotata]
MIPSPPFVDTPDALHSAYNLTPTEDMQGATPSSSRSSGRKRAASFHNEAIAKVISNINSYFLGKKSSSDNEQEEFAYYLAIVQAMEIPLD